MGLLGFFKGILGATDLPVVTSILPPTAAAEIQRGKLPQISTNSIFLKSGEQCHYTDNAILMKDRTITSYVRRGRSYSAPSLLGGTLIRHSTGRTDHDERVVTEQFPGILYVTNKRVIFQASKNGFEKPHTSLTSIAPYSNAVDLQYGSTSSRLLLPDGDLFYRLMTLLP